MAESHRSMSPVRMSSCALSLNKLCHTGPCFLSFSSYLVAVPPHSSTNIPCFVNDLSWNVIQPSKAVVSPAWPTDFWTLPTTLSTQQERRLPEDLILPNLVLVHSLKPIHPVGTTRVDRVLDYPMESKILMGKLIHTLKHRTARWLEETWRDLRERAYPSNNQS